MRNKTCKANWIHSYSNNVDLRAVTQVCWLFECSPTMGSMKGSGRGLHMVHSIQKLTCCHPFSFFKHFFMSPSHKPLKQTFHQGSFMTTRLKQKWISENLLWAKKASQRRNGTESKSLTETWQLHALFSVYKVGL